MEEQKKEKAHKSTNKEESKKHSHYKFFCIQDLKAVLSEIKLQMCNECANQIETLFLHLLDCVDSPRFQQCVRGTVQSF